MMYKLRHQKICLSGNFETKEKGYSLSIQEVS